MSRVRSKQDERQVNITLTDKGRQMQEETAGSLPPSARPPAARLQNWKACASAFGCGGQLLKGDSGEGQAA